MIAQLILNGFVTGLLLALPALALTLTFGILKFPNFAIGSMLTLGAYAAWIGNSLLGMPIAVATIFAARSRRAANPLSVDCCVSS